MHLDLSLIYDLLDLAAPVQAPLQPVNLEPAAAVAVKVTLVLLKYPSVQSVPQLIPMGLLVTVAALVVVYTRYTTQLFFALASEVKGITSRLHIIAKNRANQGERSYIRP